MVKRLFAIVLLLVLSWSVTSISKAETSTYTDSELGIQFTIPDGWEIVSEDDPLYSTRHENTKVMLQSVRNFGGTIQIMTTPEKDYTKESIKQFDVEGLKKWVLSSIASVASPKITSVEEKHNGDTMLYVVKYEMMGGRMKGALATTTTDGYMIVIDFDSLIHYEENELDFIQLVEGFRVGSDSGSDTDVIDASVPSDGTLDEKTSYETYTDYATGYVFKYPSDWERLTFIDGINFMISREDMSVIIGCAVKDMSGMKDTISALGGWDERMVQMIVPDAEGIEVKQFGNMVYYCTKSEDPQQSGQKLITEQALFYDNGQLLIFNYCAPDNSFDKYQPIYYEALENVTKVETP